MLAFTVVFEEVPLHRHTNIFQDFPERLLVQVNPTHLFLGLQVVKNTPKAMSGKCGEQLWPPSTQPPRGRWS